MHKPGPVPPTVTSGAAILTILGVFVTAYLFARFDVHEIGQALFTVGWQGLLAVCAVYLFAMALCGLAWASLLHGATAKKTLVILVVRWIRGGLSSFMPASGELVAVRTLALTGTQVTLAGASIVVDFAVESGSQVLFTVLGVGVLLAERPEDEIAYWLLASLSLLTLAVLLFFSVRRASPIQSIFGRAPAWIAKRLGLQSFRVIREVRDEVQAILLSPRRLVTAFGFHALAWIAGVGEAWIALRLLGAPLAFVDVLAIESIAFAIRSAAFALPGALGIQEGGYVMLGGLFGLSPEAGLALALVKRARELAIAVAAIMVWHLLEGKTVFARILRVIRSDQRSFTEKRAQGHVRAQSAVPRSELPSI